ncbi:MAG TPA: carboxypeptidase-like regulatory domain-containing protein [Bryobacteraceae bacterium]|nr:carboxypeptidase-like regulatory domain-containing protein [Bryobacteraceae bacterium]
MKILAAVSGLLASFCQAGVVQGTVQEAASGYPLSRSVVRLVPVPRADNIGLKQMQLRTGPMGQFVFFSVPDGYYFLISTRDGYFPGAHGQRRPNGQGTPILVTKDSDFFAQLRMHRKGAITGRVLDENNVGIAGVPVVAYRARLPLRVVGEGISDDRGVYRIHGLDAGKYWVRSATHTLDDGSGVLPTFSPGSREVREARAYDVRLDDDTPDADVHPEFGRLFNISGVLQCEGGAVKVTLTSETMHRVTQAPCREEYTFIGLAPATYEISAETADGKESGFIELFVDRMRDSVTIVLQPAPTVTFDIRRKGSATSLNAPVTVTGRRQDLYESSPAQQISTPRTSLTPGHWELTAKAGPDQYIESISNQYQVRRERPLEKAVEWFDVFIEMRGQARIQIIVGDKAAQISGTVAKEGKAVPGAPVFLWPISEDGRRSLKGYQTAIADDAGKYRFTGLPPGDYRVLSTYDFTEIDETSLDEGLAISVRAPESQVTTADLALWVAP